jgi:predicted nucleic acid-binding protein
MGVNMDNIVLDTDVCSYLFKRNSRAKPYRPHLVGRTLYLSFQTVAELYQGADMRNWGTKRRRQLDQWILKFKVLAPDDTTARIWGEIRAKRKRLGRPLSPQDAWIAACALRYNMPLLTNNAKDYVSIDGLVVISES